MRAHNLEVQAVEIIAMALKTDPANTYTDKSLMNLAGCQMSKAAASEVYKKSNVDPS